ncbi:ethylbenzene dehydrogenase-related protein [Candidatus Poribacteria bacterium]
MRKHFTILGIFTAAICAIMFMGCGDDDEDEELTGGESSTFSLGITDNSGGTHNGNSTLTLDFNGTPNATTIVPAKVSSGDISLDGSDSDWAGIEGSTVLLSPMSGSNDIDSATLKGAYDEDSIYFLVSWTDPTSTESVNKNMWTYSGGAWTQSGNEDRVFFLWNINATDFEGRGCLVYCHDDAWMGTNSPGETVDTWHWKSARTEPVGIADDKYWVDETVAEDVLDEGSRLADSGSGTASDNKADGLPELMSADDPGANVVFLHKDSTVPFDANAAWSDGDTVSGYVLKPGDGSRADVQTKAVYADGVWTVEFKRLLDTGNSDDHSFLPPL